MKRKLISVLVLLVLILPIFQPICMAVEIENVSGQNVSKQDIKVVEAKTIASETTSGDTTIVSSGSCGESATYELDSNGTLTIKGTGVVNSYYPNGNNGEVTVPPWDKNKESIIKVVVENGITELGCNCLYNCKNVSKMIIPKSVTNIVGSLSYNGDKMMTAGPIGSNADYEFGWTTTIPAYAFSRFYSLNNIMLPETITTINENAFESCAIEEITLPRGITTMKANIFRSCRKLKNIDLPENMTYIPINGFEYCTELTSIVIHDKIEYINGGAFYGCTGLTDIVIPKNIEIIFEGAFEKCSNLSSVTFEDRYFNSLQIRERAFAECSNLRNITLPRDIYSIEDKAFYKCTNLTSVKIIEGGWNVAKIGKSVFEGCTSLTDIDDFMLKIAMIEFIPESTFRGCSNLKNVTIPEEVKK